MPHAYNQGVFARADLGSALLATYLRLISVELALKNFDSRNWNSGHKLDIMIAALGRPALTPVMKQVNEALGALFCERRGGDREE